MTAKLLVICSVTILILMNLTGCYTVFRTADVAGEYKDTSNSSEYSGDIVFSSYENDRWSWYLTRPWWEESLFLKWTSHNEGDDQPPSQLIVPAGFGSGYTTSPIIIDWPGIEIERTSDTDVSGSSNRDSDGTDVRYKDEGSDDSGSSSNSSKSNTERKPARRKTSGGDK